MSDAKRNPDDISREQLLEQIVEVFGRKQEPGEPPLESLPPSKGLITNAPLTAEERNVMFWADCRFYGIKEAPPDDPIYKQGWTINISPLSQRDRQSTPGPSQHDEEQRETESRQHSKTRSGQRARLVKFLNSDPGPSPSTSSESTTASKLLDPQELMYFVRLAPLLQAQGHLAGVRAVLAQAADEGLDWVKIYTAAVNVRPTNWPPAPRLSEVAPASDFE